jgi:hypothetical protein
MNRQRGWQPYNLAPLPPDWELLYGLETAEEFATGGLGG